jgi:hypothetical protein
VVGADGANRRALMRMYRHASMCSNYSLVCEYMMSRLMWGQNGNACNESGDKGEEESEVEVRTGFALVEVQCISEAH